MSNLKMKKITKNYLIVLFLVVSSTMSAQLVLNEVLYDPDATNGDSNRDGVVGSLDDEFVELVNTGVTTLDISGYKIYDKTRFELLPGTDTPRHTFPAGTILTAGQIIVVFGDTSDNLDASLNTIRADFPAVIFQKANPDGTDINANGSLDLQNSGDDVYINNASGTNVITFKPADLSLDMSINQSAARKTSISGGFVRHFGINKTIFSPGELIYFTDTFPLVINETLFDGNGDANEDGTESFFDDEFIEFVNNSGASADISGYKIFDSSSTSGISATPRHVIPASTVIPDGGVYLVFGGGTPGSDTGSNFNGSTVHVASTASLSLSNSDDIIYVLDSSDNLVLSLDYSEIGLDMNINQSATRNPDTTGAFVLHNAAEAGVNYSPGELPNAPTLSNNNVELMSENVKIYKTNNATLMIDGLQEGNASIKIFNTLGQQVLVETFITNGTKEIDTPTLKNGIYIIQLKTGQVTVNKKIIL